MFLTFRAPWHSFIQTQFTPLHSLQNLFPNVSTFSSPVLCLVTAALQLPCILPSHLGRSPTTSVFFMSASLSDIILEGMVLLLLRANPPILDLAASNMHFLTYSSPVSGSSLSQKKTQLSPSLQIQTFLNFAFLSDYC